MQQNTANCDLMDYSWIYLERSFAKNYSLSLNNCRINISLYGDSPTLPFFSGGYRAGHLFTARAIKSHILMVPITERENTGIEGFLNFHLLWNFFSPRTTFSDTVGFFKTGVWSFLNRKFEVYLAFSNYHWGSREILES